MRHFNQCFSVLTPPLSPANLAAGFKLDTSKRNLITYPFYGIPAVIAINMIMAGASGGTVAVGIAVWAQVGVV